MTALYTVAEIRQIETAHTTARTATGIITRTTAHSRISLMQAAGEAIAACAIKLLNKRKKNVLILAGPGNNGGDAWVAARILQKQKINITVVSVGEQKHPDAVAKKAFAEYIKAKGSFVKATPSLEGGFASGFASGSASGYGLVIDGIFGIGLTQPPAGEFAHIIDAANALSEKHGIPILAIDLPSGLIADTGAAPGAVIHATTTLTFLGAKPGLYTADGSDCCGEILIDTLGVKLPPSSGTLLTESDCAALIPQRRHHSHKGTYGQVGIIGGADGMVGAAILAARAALHMGPGKVYVGLMADQALSHDPINPEIMMRTARDLAADEAITVFAIGMGIGQSAAAKSIMTKIRARQMPMLIDADALRWVIPPIVAKKSSTGAAFQAKIAGNTRPSLSFNSEMVLTPHPGEAARLLNISTAEVQHDRISAAQSIARSTGAVVVLKGNGTVIAMPGTLPSPAQGSAHAGHYFINPTGNPGMASGGMGDALSGMIAAFMAQGLSTLDAAKLGVYLHGAAADCACHHGMGPHGLTASEVIFEARTLLNTGLKDHHDE